MPGSRWAKFRMGTEFKVERSANAIVGDICSLWMRQMPRSVRLFLRDLIAPGKVRKVELLDRHQRRQEPSFGTRLPRLVRQLEIFVPVDVRPALGSSDAGNDLLDHRQLADFGRTGIGLAVEDLAGSRFLPLDDRFGIDEQERRLARRSCRNLTTLSFGPGEAARAPPSPNRVLTCSDSRRRSAGCPAWRAYRQRETKLCSSAAIWAGGVR